MQDPHCCNLWLAVIRKLVEKLSLTRGQVAVASELFAREVFKDMKASSIDEAIGIVLDKVQLKGYVEIEGESIKVKVQGTDCQVREYCPLPFYVAAGIRTLTGRRVYAISEKLVEFKEGFCIFELKEVEEPKA
jgi:hypothetical protein